MVISSSPAFRQDASTRLASHAPVEPLSFRPAVESDIPFLLELRRQTMSEHLTASGVIQSKEEHMGRVLAAFECALVVMQKSEPIGLLKVDCKKKEWELVQIQLLPSVQGQGIGDYLLRSLVQQARAANVSLRLRVLKANPARRLYERVGFVVVAEKANACEMALGAGPSPS